MTSRAAVVPSSEPVAGANAGVGKSDATHQTRRPLGSGSRAGDDADVGADSDAVADVGGGGRWRRRRRAAAGGDRTPSPVCLPTAKGWVTSAIG